MPPHEDASLSEDDLVRLCAAMEAGKRPRVYLRDAVPSLGIDAASSAQVIAVQGSTVTVRPKGIGDDVPFEASELYNSRGAAVRAAAAPAPPRRPRARKAAPAVPKAAMRESAATRVSVTINGHANGTWTVQSANGSRKLGPTAPVSVDAVAKAVAELGDTTAVRAVSAVRDHAKQAAAARVA
ncbi:MAG: hypothetical protein M3Y19_11170, partial [Actinomycetota bacterium]|nr:hypothetical protein [Actinomycetota bacterium]